MDSNALKVLLDRPIAFHRCLAAISGSANAGLMLSQAIYWTPRGREAPWFYKTQAEWFEETYLTRWEQEQARKLLRKAGLVEEVLKGVPARIHYRVDFDELARRLVQPEKKRNELRPRKKTAKRAA